jgi:hypothetical protein
MIAHAFKSPHLGVKRGPTSPSLDLLGCFFRKGAEPKPAITILPYERQEPTPRFPRESRGDFVLLNTIKSRAIAGAFAACAMIILGAAPAAASYDGSWSVSIVTTKGVCDQGMALPIQISSGRIASGHPQVGVSGRVTEGGSIVVSVIQGIKRAFGSGKLADASGSGTWRGGPCSGTWTAQRI